MLTSHAEEVLAQVRWARTAALDAMGETAAALVREQMRSGYAQPVVDTGALMADVRYGSAGEDSVQVGCTLPYAEAVHNGTAHTAARPFLTDALNAGKDALLDAAAQRIREALT